MQKVDLAPATMNRSEATLWGETDVPLSRAPSLPDLGGDGLVRRILGSVSRLTDAQVALLVGGVLFAISAWPLALTEVPPYQDLPNHFAAVTVIQHPEKYPEFVSNGFLKTNAALFTWLCFVGRVLGVKVAGKLFALLVLGLNALVIPNLVLTLTGSRKKLVVASLFAWPMVHNWFVSMGMLDFALGVPLSLLVLVLLHKRLTPGGATWKNAVLIAAIAAGTWYAHVFTLMVVHLLVAVHVVVRPSWRERLVHARLLFLPLFPTTVLVVVSLVHHFGEPVGLMTGFVSNGRLLPPWELVYNLWAEWFYGFTWLSVSTIVPCVALGLLSLLRWKKDVTFFSPLALIVLGLFFAFSPYIATNWFHVNSRFIPFIWMALLVRVPDRLPRRLAPALAVCAVAYSIGMGVDFVRLDRDRAQFTAGIDAVPEGARLLPLVFRRKLTSENTRSLQHTWGFYVMEKQTSAPLLFAHSASFPVMYKEPPAPQFNHLVLEGFAPSMGTPEWMCGTLNAGGICVTDCEGEWRERWADFWRQAEPQYDHVLMWDATPQAMALVPASYRVKFSRERLTVYERTDSRVSAR